MAVPGNINILITNVAPGKIIVSWSAADRATSYRVARKVDSGSWVLLEAAWTGTTYTDTDVVPSSAYTYTIRPVNEDGQGNAKTSTTVSPLPSSSPLNIKIDMQPANAIGVEGSTALFTIIASGHGTLRYQWQQSTDGDIWMDIPGATGSSLSFTLAAAYNGTMVRCIVSDDLPAQRISEAALITVQLTSDTIDIVLQRNNSEDTHVVKTLTTLQTFSGILREQCSIIDPVIVFEEPVTSFVGANYLTIESFGRSYFILSITALDTYRTEISAHVDVLSSFATEIKANKGIVHRQENRWNLYLNDGVLRAYQNPMVDTIVFPSGFSGQSYVLLTSGFHGGGSNVGSQNGVSVFDSDLTGGGNVYSKTTAGLLTYAKAQLGKPYWWGTFGNIADQNLLDAKKYQYPSHYPDSDDFTVDFSKRVHDCVGLVKGYRWSQTPSSTPVYNASEDVDCTGMFYQCVGTRTGTIAQTTDGIPIGSLLFVGSYMPNGSYRATHVGIFSGTGKVIEARGREHGVVESNLSDRPLFTHWGIPSWLQVATARAAIT